MMTQRKFIYVKEEARKAVIAECIKVAEEACYIGPLGTAEHAWNDACDHIIIQLRNLIS